MPVTRKPFALLLLSAGFVGLPSIATQTWGGSLAATSDYLVRGISRSNHTAAVQGDVYVALESGFIGGASSSSVQVSPGEQRNAELSAFLGFAWDGGSPWRTKILASHYSYPWNDAGAHYNYDELSIDAAYEGWLDFNVTYSPNAPRYLPSVGLIGVTATSAEINLRTPWRDRLAAATGVGYSRLTGPDGAGYAYWSAGAMYDVAPWSFSLSYVNTNSGGAYLYYSAAAHDRWVGTVIWRF